MPTIEISDSALYTLQNLIHNISQFENIDESTLVERLINLAADDLHEHMKEAFGIESDFMAHSCQEGRK